MACKEDPLVIIEPNLTAVESTFGGKIKLDNLANYANQPIPDYIAKDNTSNNVITDAGATLGRVLFYDKNLSIDNTIACAACHQQAVAFSDPRQASIGVNGSTARHSMRLVNARFGQELRFFWDERALSLEDQTTQPIQDHAEMGYSGENGDPDFADLIEKLENIDYYQELFTFVYGDSEINEDRMQLALAQFIRSIQSFDSKFDIGRAQVADDLAAFPNFTNAENLGKSLFINLGTFDEAGIRTGGGLGCGGCHTPPEFDIEIFSLNNGVTGTIDGTGPDFNVTRSPSLRDVVKADGSPNGPMMHTGSFNNLNGVINHYNQINSGPANNMLDARLRPNGFPQNLMMPMSEKNALTAFIKTLAGQDVYTDERWSDPF